MAAERVRLLLADPLPLFRDGLRALLAGEFDVRGDAATGEDAVSVARRTRPGVVILDAQMPGLSGIDAARIIRAELPETRVIILTADGSERTVTQCLEAGVHGFVLKEVETADLVRQIRAVARGGYVLDPKVAGMVLRRLRGEPGEAAADATAGRPPLSDQQVTILRLMARGSSNREIAEQLHLSENTVKGYSSEVLQRIGARNRVEASRLAVERGWV